MANVKQTNHIQGKSQKQSGLLGALFNVMSLFPETAMIGQAGNAFLNPSGTNLGSLATSTAKMIGGGDSGGELSGKQDEPEIIDNPEEESKENKTASHEVGEGLNITATDVGGKTPDPITDESSEKKNEEENPLSMYSNMTMDEVFKMYPELQGMFTQHLFQA